MKLALNISPPAERLWREGRIRPDYFKCPAWPDLVQRIHSEFPTYVHFPLSVGLGLGDAMNTETRQRPDWGQIESFFAGSATRHVNVHLSPKAKDFPDLPHDLGDTAGIEQVTERLIADVTSVAHRFGPEKVIVEGIYSHDGTYLPQAFVPEVITRVIETTGCGFLFDLSHSRMAAQFLGIDPQDYIARLPMRHIREMHVTGIQKFDEPFVDRLRRARLSEDIVQRFAGRLMDHLPMTDSDWQFLAWSIEQIRQGAWGTPWIISYEYGGIGSWWESIIDESVLTEQIPRMNELIHGNGMAAALTR